MSAPLSAIPASVLRGLRWSMIATFGIAILQLLYTGLMSRLLTPADFGLVGMAAVIISFGGYFAQMGLEQALIQRAELEEGHVRAAFTVAVGLGLLVTALMWLLAPVVAPLLFAEPKVVPVLRGLSLTFTVLALGATATALLRRRMAFDLLARVDLASFIIGYGVVGVGLASTGWGIWSLVAATLTNQLCAAVFAWLGARHSLRPAWGWAHYRPLLHFGGAVSAVSLLEFLGANLDRIGIGRLLGNWTLGVYNRAFMLVHLPLYQLSTSISRVLLPSFSNLQHELHRLRPLYLTALSLSAWVLLPLAAGTGAAAYPVVRVVLGEQWLAAVPLLGPLALVVGVNLLSIYSGILCESLAKLRFKISLQLGYVLLLAAGMWLAAPQGLHVMVWLLLAAEILRHTAYQIGIVRYLHIPVAELVQAYVPALATAVGTGTALLAARLGLEALHLGALVQLLLLLAAGAVSLLGQLALPWNRSVRQRLHHELAAHLPSGKLRNKILTLLAAGRWPRGWWTAVLRVRLAGFGQRLLLGRLAAALPAAAIRSVVEVCGWPKVRPHVPAVLTVAEPVVSHYDFPAHYPPYFRRYKAFGPLQAYVLRDVCVSPHSGLAWLPEAGLVLAESIGSVRRLSGWGNHVPELLLPVAPLPVAGPVLACPPGPFFHWLTETLPNVLAALRRWPDLTLLLPPPAACPAFFNQALAAALDPDWQQRVVRADGPVRVPELRLLPVESDAGFVHPAAVRELRRALRRPLAEAERQPVRALYVSRRQAPARQLAGEAALETALAAAGVEVVCAEELDFAAQVRVFAQAQVLVGLHGAGLSHMLWARRGLRVLEIFPADYFNDCYARLALTLGHSYRYVVADAGPGLPVAAIVAQTEQLLAPDLMALT